MKHVILLTVELYPDAIGGGGQYARYIHELLTIKTMTLKRRVNLSSKGVIQMRLPFITMKHRLFLIAYPLYVIKAMLLILRERPALVISNTFYDVLPPMLTGTPFTVILHDIVLFKIGVISRALAKIALKKSIAVVSPSKAATSMLPDKIARQIGGKVAIIPNPVDVNSFGEVDPMWARDWLYSKIGLENYEEPRIILYVGPTSTFKGVHVLLNAFTKLSKERNDLLLILVGPKGDKEGFCLSPQIKRLGIVGPPDLCYLYVAADVIVNPSMFEETQGRTIIESLAAKRHIVASSIPAFVETGGEAGCYFKQGDADDLHFKLKEVLKRIDAGFRENSKATEVVKNYTPVKFKESWLTLIGKALVALNEPKYSL